MFYLSGFADEICDHFQTQLEVLADLNIHAIELRGVNGQNLSQLSLEETKQIHEMLTQYHIRVSALGSPLGKISLQDDFAPHLDLFRHMMQQAQILETSYVRIFSFYDANAEGARAQVMDRLEQFLHCTPGGITLLHENEKGIYGDTAERCLDILSYFEGTPLLATFDPANLIQVGEPSVPGAFNLLKPYIAYVHVKDALYQTGEVVPAGMGDAAWPQLIEALRQMQYKGYLSLEPHLADFTGFQGLELAEDVAKTPQKADKSRGESLFRLAAEKLRQLLKEEEIQ